MYSSVSSTLFLLVVLAVSAGTLALKNIVIFAQATFSLVFIGVVVEEKWLWATGSLFYFAGLLAYVPMLLLRGHGSSRKQALLSWVPWHKRGVYGSHEDCHALIAAGDLCYFIAAAVHVRGSSCGSVGAVGA